MKTIVLHPAYFGSIHQFSAIAKAEKLLFENEDNYQKQTYRSRQYIYGANGKLLLNIPIKHNKTTEKHQKYKDVKIENEFKWQVNHWRSLEAAYRTSPFFEFYEDELKILYKKEYTHLLGFNYDCFEAICDCLQLEPEIEKTTEYFAKYTTEGILDYRDLINAKKKRAINFEKYNQVFQDKYGFIENLSILDLLFNEGPNALVYLEELNINLNSTY